MDSIKTNIILYQEANQGYQWAGPICRAVHEITGSKEAVIERRLRELENAGKIEKTKQQIDGRGPKCVLYRLKPETKCIPTPMTMPPPKLEDCQLAIKL